MDQPEGWLPHKNVPSLTVYVTEHEATAPIRQNAGTQESIDADRAALILKQLEYDQRFMRHGSRNVPVSRQHGSTHSNLGDWTSSRDAGRTLLNSWLNL